MSTTICDPYVGIAKDAKKPAAIMGLICGYCILKISL
jgi:hypothetical protein